MIILCTQSWGWVGVGLRLGLGWIEVGVGLGWVGLGWVEDSTKYTLAQCRTLSCSTLIASSAMPPAVLDDRLVGWLVGWLIGWLVG